LIIALPIRGKDMHSIKYRGSFARAKYFIIVKREDNRVVTLGTIKNPYRNLKRKAESLVLKMLKEKGVEAIVVHEANLELTELAKEVGIRIFSGNLNMRNRGS